jgi:pimeloyl-ACP methyl ester carboxylesterase
MSIPKLPVRLRRPAGSSHQSKEPVRTLLLHGLGGGAGTWDPLVDRMDDRFELWDVELPWSLGRDAQWALDADLARWVNAAVQGMRVVGGAPPGLLLAHSFAANALLEATGLPDGPGTVPTVLINPFYRPDPADFEWGAISYYTDGFYRMLEEGLRLRAGARFSDAERSAMALRLCELIGPYPWLRFFDTFLRTPLCELDALKAPVLLIGGGLDRGAKADGVRALAKRIPSARVEVLEDCGHFPMIEQPDRLAALIAGFAEDACGAPGVPSTVPDLDLDLDHHEEPNP